jgi:hypothetical protein
MGEEGTTLIPVVKGFLSNQGLIVEKGVEEEEEMMNSIVIEL